MKKVLICDFDGVITSYTQSRALAEELGVVGDYDKLVASSSAESFKSRAKVLLDHNLNKTHFDRLIERMPIEEGTAELFEAAKRNGFYCVIASYGYDYLINKVVKKFAVDEVITAFSVAFDKYGNVTDLKLRSEWAPRLNLDCDELCKCQLVEFYKQRGTVVAVDDFYLCPLQHADYGIQFVRNYSPKSDMPKVKNMYELIDMLKSIEARR